MNINQLKEYGKSNTEIANLGTEKVGKKAISVYYVAVDKKDKDGNISTEMVEIRDSKAIANFVDIDIFAEMRTLSVKGFVVAMARFSVETAKQCGYKSVVSMVARQHKEYSTTTLNMYRRVGLMFADKNADGYMWRAGIPQSASVNNLSVILALASKGENLEELKESEIDSLYEEFYENYIATDKIHLLLPQSALKKEVKYLNSDIIDGEAKEIETSEETSKNTEKSDNSGEKSEKSKEIDKFSYYKDTLAEMSEYFKGNENIVNAIANLIIAMTENSDN